MGEMEDTASKTKTLQDAKLTVKVTVGVCGGIAAYKALDLVRALQQAGLDPYVVMTNAAEEFVTPLTFAAISGHKVITSLWAGGDGAGAGDVHDSAIEHIAEAQTTEVLIVAPATSDTLAKFAHGLADDFLSTMYLATPAPVIVAPAMNVTMWEHAATQANVATLESRGVIVVPPGSGYLACGMTGSGRLADTSALVAAVVRALELNGQRGVAPVQDLTGETVLITAGGTREAIDPVRFIGNRSSGKMGYALAIEARARGARVVLVSAATALPVPKGCEFVGVTTADEMRRAVMENLACATIVLGAAAVSDFRPVMVSSAKLRRSGALTIELESTADILAEASRERRPKTLLVAFAAETDSANAVENGRAKMLRKGVDAVVVNDVSVAGIGFDADENAAVFVTRDAEREIAKMSKREMAKVILDEVMGLSRTSDWSGRESSGCQKL
jgi:phosphopantothenoylcysteine decarboxylase/phosphopantothenate--cysteine ligase